MLYRSDYPKCKHCDCTMEPIWFEEKELRRNSYDGQLYPTGRKRIACSHFTCPECLRNECADNSFDGPWHY